MLQEHVDPGPHGPAPSGAAIATAASAGPAARQRACMRPAQGTDTIPGAREPAQGALIGEHERMPRDPPDPLRRTQRRSPCSRSSREILRSQGVASGSPDNGGLVRPAASRPSSCTTASAALATSPPDDGIIYVKLRVPRLKGLVALRDTTGDGRADEMQVRRHTDTGDYGTAMRIHNGHIYSRPPRSTGSDHAGAARADVAGRNRPQARIQVACAHEHIAKAIARRQGPHSVRAPGDSCQSRTAGRSRRRRRARADWQGGIWEFSDSKLNQTEQDGRRYATGIRSIVGMWNRRSARSTRCSTAATISTARGRATSLAGRARAAVRGVLRDHRRLDGGWPHYYYDQIAGKKKLNPDTAATARRSVTATS